MELYGVTANGVSVFNATEIGGHCHADVAPFVGEAIEKIELDSNTTFARFAVKMGKVVGVNHLIATTESDIIKYARRGNRAGETRFVLNRAAEPTEVLNLVLCVATEAPFEGKWVLVTAFAGEQGEREPWDVSLKTEEAKARAAAFWATHALVPTEAERVNL